MLTAMIFAKDLDRMTEFYRDGFGLTVVPSESSDGFVVLHGDGARVALHAVPEHVTHRIEIADPPAARSEVAIKLLFAVDDVGVAIARLERLGAQLFETEGDDAYDALDPEGNVLRVHAAA